MALTPVINYSSTDQAFLVLLTVTPADGQDPLYIVNNNEAVVSRGVTYEPYPFSILLPADTGEQQQNIRIVIDNVDLRLTEIVRELLDPPTVKLEVVLSGSPNTVEKTVDFMRLTTVNYDAAQLQGTLNPVDILNQPAIDSRYTGTEFPDLLYE